MQAFNKFVTQKNVLDFSVNRIGPHRIGPHLVTDFFKTWLLHEPKFLIWDTVSDLNFHTIFKFEASVETIYSYSDWGWKFFLTYNKLWNVILYFHVYNKFMGKRKLWKQWVLLFQRLELINTCYVIHFRIPQFIVCVKSLIDAAETTRYRIANCRY